MLYVTPPSLGRGALLVDDDARVAAAGVGVEARMAALALMTQALEQLDSDTNIPSIIAAQLQSAIDMLWANSSSERMSTNLH